MVCLGVDTSNYTTSAAISVDGKVTANVRKLLRVAEGERGLRQSDAVFQHTVNLPSVFDEIGKQELRAVGVSATPRDNEGSYMPCFLAGVATATAVAQTAGVPLYRFSHQAGHIAAALYSCGQEALHHREFLAFHVSGGTTELTHVKHGKIELLGGTRDISAGKAIDRVGVMLGLTFPCGGQLESLAGDIMAVKAGKLSVDGFFCNLSGLENKASDMIKNGAAPSDVAAYVLRHVLAVLERMTENALSAYSNLPVIYAGGVMSNRAIRTHLTDRFGGYFAEPCYSCDNAAGIARLTELKANGQLP
ncbi:MAG: peptidase M22 [Clostridia bacterium]|nr:peptidase M22 [Clostridia bacterium]